MSFQVALSTVLLTLFYIAPGYLIGKARRASADHLSSLSAVLIYICAPCMHVSAFLGMDFSWEAMGGMGLFFLVTLALPFSAPFKASILILSATPCASIILNLAEMHRSQTELSADRVLVSTLMCFLTIPVLTLLL